MKRLTVNGKGGSGQLCGISGEYVDGVLKLFIRKRVRAADGALEALPAT